MEAIDDCLLRTTSRSLHDTLYYDPISDDLDYDEDD
jgi:hypothetical protein